MVSFARYFRRLGPGLWECVVPTECNGMHGRIQITQGSRFARGTSFMGFDLSKLLDEEYERRTNRR